jgi:hypothetical protein
MDTQTVINVLGGIVMAGVGWAARELWGAVKALRADLQKLEVALPTSYVSKSDFDKVMTRIEDMFKRIYDKLDEKADKP